MSMLFGEGLDRPTLPPGVFHLPGHLDLRSQAWIVGQLRRLARGPVPPHSPRIQGHRMSVSTLCLGWHWSPYQYTRRAIDVNGHHVPPVPDWLVRLGHQALIAAGQTETAAGYLPDVAIINYYPPGATMGMHQDKDEANTTAPIVSVSLGDTCTFRLGNTTTKTKPYQDILLRSGDVLIFGGPARLAYHGVPKVFPHTAPPGCGVDQGRFNITLRVTGFDPTSTS